MTSASETLPYNDKNILLMDSDVHAILSKYGINQNIRDVNIYRKAFIHRSYCTRKNENFLNGNALCPAGCLPLQEESNERLEFLGDSVIGTIIARYVYERYDDENEGFLTKLRTKLVNGNSLAQFASILNIGQFLIISKQIEDNEGRTSKKLLEDAFEAFIGAMLLDFEDNGFRVCTDWLVNFLESTTDFAELIASNSSYKDSLIKYYQYNFKTPPQFLELNIKIVNGQKIFHICIKDNNENTIAVGKGASRKEAENNASRQALEYYSQALK